MQAAVRRESEGQVWFNRGMSDMLLAVWHHNRAGGSVNIVLPDGCRDLIVKINGKAKPVCFVSPLFDTAQAVPVDDGASLTGFRLRPGVMLDEQALISFAASCPFDHSRLENALDDFVTVAPAVQESLACLSEEYGSVHRTAKQLGVSDRTLQRTIMTGTGRSPGYWLQLARARRAARALARPGSLAEMASHHGFSDQSHMNREFRRWFRTTPGELSKADDLLAQLNSPAYG